MYSILNPISLLETAVVEAIKESQVTIGTTEYMPFQGTPAKVSDTAGSDEEIIQKLHADGASLPRALVRWSGWQSAKAQPTANVIGYMEQSGTIQIDVFFGCFSARSQLETKRNILGVVGYQDAIVAILEQLDPEAIGLATSTRNTRLNGKFQYFYFQRVEKISFSSSSSIFKLNFVAVLNPLTTP